MKSRADLGERRASFRGSFRTVSQLVALVAIVLLLACAYRWWKVGDVVDVVSTAKQALLLWVGISAALVLFVKLHVTHVHEHGLAGRNYWSFPVRMKWADVEGWRLGTGSGVAAVVLCERDSTREMWIFRDVFFSERFQDAIRHFQEIPDAAET